MLRAKEQARGELTFRMLSVGGRSFGKVCETSDHPQYLATGRYTNPGQPPEQEKDFNWGVLCDGTHIRRLEITGVEAVLPDSPLESF